MLSLNFEQVEKKIGYKFKNKQLLEQAFVHSSYANEEKVEDNERMEFFGDAILEYITSEYLYKKYPEYTAGELSKLRSQVVSAEGLRPVVDELNILEDLLVANGSDKIRSLSRKIEANLYEAVLCAIYFDGGMAAARKFVMLTLKKGMDSTVIATKDYKTLLQEYCQERKWQIAYLREGRTGPDNNPNFTYSLWINNKKVAEGSGSSIKNAQQAAAAKIVEKWKIKAV